MILVPGFARRLTKNLNSELTKKALEKVGNPNTLVNLVSRRVRQLNSGGGASSRPQISGAEHMGAADIALAELIDEKVLWEHTPEEDPEAARKKKRA